MKDYSAENMRNIALVGHGSSGKTSLAAAFLFDTGATTRLTKVDKGNTVTDYDPDEIERQISINATPCFVEWGDHKINVIDTPGYSNFLWDTRAALRAVDGAAVLVDAVAGVEVGTEKVWGMLEEFGLPRLIVITRWTARTPTSAGPSNRSGSSSAARPSPSSCRSGRRRTSAASSTSSSARPTPSRRTRAAR